MLASLGFLTYLDFIDVNVVEFKVTFLIPRRSLEDKIHLLRGSNDLFGSDPCLHR